MTGRWNLTLEERFWAQVDKTDSCWIWTGESVMAIRVVGEAPEAVKHATCRNCAARLEYVPADVKSRITRDYTGDSSEQQFIPCPRCGGEVVLRSW